MEAYEGQKASIQRPPPLLGLLSLLLFRRIVEAKLLLRLLRLILIVLHISRGQRRSVRAFSRMYCTTTP